MMEWKELKQRLSGSKFRSRFRLGKKEAYYARDKGLTVIAQHAFDFIRKRLAPEAPLNDGKQTPMRGHPVFIAQHATASCCRGCLEKWHHIPCGREMTEEEISGVVEVIMAWIKDQIREENC